MSPVTFYKRWIHLVGWVVFIVALLASYLLISAVTRLPTMSTASASPTMLEWTLPETPSTNWLHFRRAKGNATADNKRTLQERFRLAGTFFEFTAMGSRSRQAILDDRVKKRQHIVREREKIDDIEIAGIRRDHVILKDSNGEEIELWLSLSGGPAGSSGTLATASDETRAETAKADEQPDAHGARRTGPNSWLIKREKLMEYYKGLWDDAERMVLLFDSLKPVYTPEGWIRGYVLGVEGEGDFFNSMGLVEGDIVRSVNGVEMTNRRRAEYFVEQVVQNEASALVLAVQRGGVTNKFTYQVRD